MRMLYLLASGRQHGNAELMAREAASAQADGHEHVFVRLSDYPLPAFVDYRRVEDYAQLQLDTNSEKLYRETLLADLIVLATPVYCYSFPASLKLYLDLWSTWMRIPGLRFREDMAGKHMDAHPRPSLS